MQSKVLSLLIFFIFFISGSSAQSHDTAHDSAAHVPAAVGHQVSDNNHVATSDSHDHGEAHASHDGHEFDPAGTAIHHISDGNVYSILDWVRIPLPMILYAKDKGWDFFMSSKFHPGHHEDGHMAYNGYVMQHGSVHRVVDGSFPTGEQHVDSFTEKEEQVDGKAKTIKYALVGGKEYRLDEKSTLDGGLLGGGMTSFMDFSITKNVMSMFIIFAVLFILLRAAAKRYIKNPDKAPKGVASFIEPVIVFLRDEVAIPFLGKDKYKKFFPMLLAFFFFILGLNLFGQVPFLGSVNVTGNIALTMVLAVIVFIVVNINGNKHYWQHIFWMPGVSIPMKILLAIIELMSLFIKPLTLMLRLAGNISGGHIAILSFIGLIFVFGKSGQSMTGAGVGTALAVPLTLFMMAIELLVAFLQAYVFTLLAASYIGAATEEHHGHDDHH